MKSVILVVAVLLSLNVAAAQRNQRRHPGEDDNSSNFPRDDFSKFFRDLQSTLGLDSKSLEKWNRYFTKLIYEGQVYTWRQFERDYAKVKASPSFSNILGFIRKVWWPAIVHGCGRVVGFFQDIAQFLLRFLEKKCDKHIGRHNQFHPWNILKTQDATNISFLVFVYMVALSLILIKLLTLWNFTMYLATTFLLYYLGGPQLLFKWLLTFTALAWFVLDIVLRNPLQVALLIVVFYILNIAKHFIISSTIKNQRASSMDANNTAGYSNAQRRKSSARAAEANTPISSDGPDRAEFNLLSDRIEGMERRTNMLVSKLDKLAKTLEKVVPDDEI